MKRYIFSGRAISIKASGPQGEPGTAPLLRGSSESEELAQKRLGDWAGKIEPEKGEHLFFKINIFDTFTGEIIWERSFSKRESCPTP